MASDLFYNYERIYTNFIPFMLALALYLALTDNFPIMVFFICCLEKVILFIKYCVGVCMCNGLLGAVS